MAFRPVAISDTEYEKLMKQFLEDKDPKTNKMTFAQYAKKHGWKWSKKDNTFYR